MRVASPFNDYSKDSLNLYRVIDPEIWTKLVGRVQGANFAAIYGHSKAMGYRNVTLPEGHTWEILHAASCWTRCPLRLRNNYVQKFQNLHHLLAPTRAADWTSASSASSSRQGYNIRRNGVSSYTRSRKSRVVFIGKIPDNTDDIRSTKDIPSWKRMCYCILKNDHNCRFMGFGLTRQQQQRISMPSRKKYSRVEEMENEDVSEPGL